MRTRAEMKAQAKQAIKSQFGSVVGAYFLYALLLGVPLCAGAATLGYTRYNLELVRGNRPKADLVMSGFNTFGRAWFTAFWVALWIMIWSIIPIAGVFFGIWKTLSYSMIFHISVDYPEINGRELLTESKWLTKGHCGKLFVFSLSFLPWILLTTAPLIVGQTVVIVRLVNSAMSASKYVGDAQGIEVLEQIGIVAGSLPLLLILSLVTFILSSFVYMYIFAAYSLVYEDLMRHKLKEPDAALSLLSRQIPSKDVREAMARQQAGQMNQQYLESYQQPQGYLPNNVQPNQDTFRQ